MSTSKRVLFVFVVLAGCAREPAAEPPAPEPQEPVAAAPSGPPEPTATQVPIAADFHTEASKAITAETYKAELASIAKELEGDEAAAKAP